MRGQRNLERLRIRSLLKIFTNKPSLLNGIRALKRVQEFQRVRGERRRNGSTCMQTVMKTTDVVHYKYHILFLFVWP